MLELLPNVRQQFFDENGDPLAGGKLYSYIAGTTTPQATYQDANGSTPNANPIILDANGYADVWIVPGGGAYKFVLTDADDVVQFTVDDVTISGPTEVSGWSELALTNNMSATAISGFDFDTDDYKGMFVDVHIRRGTTIAELGQVWVGHRNGTGYAQENGFTRPHGCTFDISQVGTTVTLTVATDSSGTGELVMSRRLIPA